MAAFETRTHPSGTSFRVKWRQDGQWQSATFPDKATARRFKKDVELYDNHWPEHGWLRVGSTVRPLTQADLAAAPAAPEEARRAGDDHLGDLGGTPFGPYAAQYVRDKTGLQPDTRTRYANQAAVLAAQLDVIVASDPGIAAQHATVENLTSRHISRWINGRESEGAAPKTIRNWHGLLFQVLQAATDEGLRGVNPCVSTGRALPRQDGARTHEPKVFLTEQEFRLIAAAMWPGLPDPRRGGRVVAVGTRMDRDLIVTAVGTGARWGELTALVVGDVELDPVARVRVERAWKANGVGDFARRDAGRKYLGPPKTVKGRRRIRVGGALTELLRIRTAGRAPEELLFARPDGGPVNQGHFYRHRWRRAVVLAQRNGLAKEPRFHDLRHTYAAWLISAGVPLPEVQQRLGHESIQTTVDVYGGLLEAVGDLADRAIDDALGGR